MNHNNRFKNISSANNSNNFNSIVTLEKNKKEKILIVDDNQIISDSNKKIISSIIFEKKLDFEIIIGHDGSDIISWIINEDKRKLLRIIITDENMDFLNGSDAIKFIRDLENRNKIQHIYIICVTCHEDTNIISKIINSGADLVLSKPITKSSIERFIDKFVNKLEY